MNPSSCSNASTERRSFRSTLAVLWLAAWGLLGGALLWGAGDTARTDAAANSTSTVSHVETTPVSYQPIEAVQVGDRVLTQATESQEAHDASTTSIHAPEAEPSSASARDLDAEPVDPDTWKRVELRPVGDDPGRVEIVLLRPTWWLEAHDARLGGRITLHMSELGLSGPCRVVAIGPCPPIEPGPGRVVTGAFNRPGARVLDLHLEGEPAPIGTTASHPFYSLDRAAFVSAGDLAVGERLKRLDGRPARVARLETRPELQRVFNLEVHGEHVYRVADAGVLVHNSCSRKRINGETPHTIRGREAHSKYNPGPGFQKEVVLPSGKRPDGVHWDDRIVSELKPNNRRARRRGERQLSGYVDELEHITGDKWASRLDTYDP